MRSSYAIDKMRGAKLPNPLLKSKGSVIRTIFLEYRTKQATVFARRNFFLCIVRATNKKITQKAFSCSCSDTIYSKSIKKNNSISQHFPNVKV